jgi:hypothetical protein
VVDELIWRKASLAGRDGAAPMAGDSGGNDVEVAALADGGMAVRNSSDPSGPVLRFTAGEWDAFVDGALKGEFDLA